MAYACRSIPAILCKVNIAQGEGTGNGWVCPSIKMATWKNFKNAMKEKRTAKRKAPSHDILQKEEIVIQRLSPEVSGKAQKYSRIGAREFVPFEYDEVTLDNINNACRRHFAPVVGERMVCDVLAGEQGPSCTSLEQIPDLKVVHVRFIEPNDGDDGDAASMTAHDRKPRLERGLDNRSDNSEDQEGKYSIAASYQSPEPK